MITLLSVWVGILIISEKISFFDEKRGNPLYYVPKYPLFLAILTKFETFHFQIFCSIKRKTADQMKTSICNLLMLF